MMSDQENPNLLQLVVQLATLEQRLQPLLPAISQKLITDLLASGVKKEKLAKVIGRPPSYVVGIAAGSKSLSPQMIVKVLRHVAMSQKGADDAAQG